MTEPCGPLGDCGPVDLANLATLAEALAWGTLVGGACQLLVQLPAVRSLAPGVRPRLRPITDDVREVVRAFVPVVGARGVVQLATFVDLVLASLLAGAALATLQKVTILAVLPVSLFGMAVAAAELPELSGDGAQDPDRVRRRINDGLERAAFYVLPTIIGYLVVGEVLVAALFQTGAFGDLESRLVWLVLVGSTFGLLATTSSRLLQSAMYGRGDTKGPAKLAIVRVVLSTSIGLLLMFQLDRYQLLPGGAVALAEGASLPALSPLPPAVRDADVFRLGALGLTIAGSVGALVEYRLLRELVESRTGGRVRIGGSSRGRLLLAGLAATAAAFLIRPVATDLTPVLGGLVAVTAVAAAHIGAAVALGLDEAQALVGAVNDRLRR